MKILRDRKFNKMMGRLNQLEKSATARFDGLQDPLTTRGSREDRTQRLIGNRVPISNYKALSMYFGNGFAQNIVEIPAEDAVREGIEIKTNLDAESDFNYVEAIENRMKDLNIHEKIFELIRFSRLYAKGSFLYYAVKANAVQSDEQLAEPLPSEIKSIEFINVIDDPDRVTITNLNTSDPTKEDYNKIKFSMAGHEIHPSRLSWLVNSFLPSELTGISVIQTVNDAIIAQDNGLWSSATILNSMALNIFKSDEISDLSPTQKAELLAKIKHLMITFSSLALKSDEAFEQLSLTMTGMKEIFDFIFDNLGGLARIPKNILLGKAHGVVTAGEYDTLNYYANIARYQENKLKKIYEKIIDLIVNEQNGEIYNELDGNTEDFQVDIEFNTLWKLDPVAEADTDLKKSQRDQIDVTIGKTSPEELRQLDPRYSGLDPFVMNREFPPDMTPPVIPGEEPEPDNELEVPEEKETTEENSKEEPKENPDEDLELPEEKETIEEEEEEEK
jgi:phage-related protein (TIGR01555 family)